MTDLRCELLHREDDVLAWVWVAHVDDVPVGFIQVGGKTDVTDVIYVEPTYRGPYLAVADRLIETAGAARPGLCHDGRQAESGEKLMQRCGVPAHPEANIERWDEAEAEKAGRLMWNELRKRHGL